jgi:hypothetical protein
MKFGFKFTIPFFYEAEKENDKADFGQRMCSPRKEAFQFWQIHHI